MADTRALYLNLMEKTLLGQIYEDPPQDPWTGGQYRRENRETGRDWPSVAHTMVGRRRLHNIRELCEDVLQANVPGDFIETGIWRGGSCILMRAVLKAYGCTDRTVWCADSFQGLPEPDAAYQADDGDSHHTYPQLAISEEEVCSYFEKYDLLDTQVRFLKGWFKDTLPYAPIEQLAILRLDGDMYGSTIQAFDALYDKLSPGGYLIVDDYGAVPGCEQATTDFRAAHGIQDEIIPIDWTGAYWKKSS